MDISRRRAREDGATVGTFGLGYDTGFLPLVAQKIAKGRKFAAITAVVEALRFWSIAHYPWVL